jgi:hypothetical protein
MQELGMPQSMRLLNRFAAGLLAIIVSGFLTNGPWGHPTESPAFANPASLEMMRLLRDEHGLVVDMAKSQLAAEEREPERQRAATVDPDATLGAIEQLQGNRRALRAHGRRNI